MPYYQGDYYRGDPGVLGFLGRFGKTIAGTAASFVPGIGGIASRVLSKIPGPGQQIIRSAGAAIVKHPVLSAAGAAGVVGATGGAVLSAHPTGGAMTLPGGAGMPSLAPLGGMMPGMSGVGIRLSRTGKRIRFSLRTGKAIRRMRPTNPKALRRAIRRAKGFERLARRVLHFTSPKKSHGRAVFKARRRKRA